MVQSMANNNDDPIFSIPGDLAINWWYSNNDVRIALTGGKLSPAEKDDGNTYGLGNYFMMEGKTGISKSKHLKHEISNIHNCHYPSCPQSKIRIHGTDHGSVLTSGPVYGNYAIYVSKDARRCPTFCKMLMLGMERL